MKLNKKPIEDIKTRFKQAMTIEYIGIKYQDKSKLLIDLLKTDIEAQDKLECWLKIEELLREYRNYKTTFDAEIVYYHIDK